MSSLILSVFSFLSHRIISSLDFLIEVDSYNIYDLFLKSFGVRFKSILGLDCKFFNSVSVIIFF